MPHTERDGQAAADCLGRIVGTSRSNVRYSDALGEGVAEVNVLPGSLVSGETLHATVELVGFRGPRKMPSMAFFETRRENAVSASLHVSNA